MNRVPHGSDGSGRDTPHGWLTAFIALAAGVAISNNYALLPALPAVAQTFHVPLTAMGVVAGSMQAGYMAGIVLLVPFGDKVSPARIVSWQFALLALALLAAGYAPGLPALAIAGCVTGAMATNAVHLAAVAFRTSQPQSRGRAVGTVGTGVSAGILLSRFVGGLISQELGWRTMLMLFAVAAFLLACLTRRLLPKETPRSEQGYFGLLRSLPSVLLRYRLLREGVVVGACWFFVFSMIWVTLVLAVARAPLNLNAAQAGMFSFAGALGLFATRAAGRAADRFGYRPVIACGFALLLAGVITLFAARSSIAGTAIGLVLFDVGCFSAQVANQTRLLAIDANARSRIYSVYMFCYYAAGALGSVLGPLVFVNYGWDVVCTVSLALAALGLAITLIRHLAAQRSGEPVAGPHAAVVAGAASKRN
jgi:predicted MFS family arabinose efflux permease